MGKIIIFGILDTAELALYYLSKDSEHEVVAFTVHRSFIDKEAFYNLPIVAFEDIELFFPPTDYLLFAPMTGKRMNKIREQVYTQGKNKGYSFISYVSTKANVFNSKIGENCFILEDNNIQPFVEIGNNVVLWSGNHIGHHSQIKDHVFFTSHVVLSGHCIVNEFCFLGVNSTVRDYSQLARGTLVGMSSSVMKNTEEWGVYVGNPAKKLEGKNSIDIY